MRRHCGQPPPWFCVLGSPYATFLADKNGPAGIAITTRDASLHVLAGAHPDSDDIHCQARHETLAGVLSPEAAPA